MDQDMDRNRHHFDEPEDDKRDQNFDSEKDPAGTDPDRYKYISSDTDEKADGKREDAEGRNRKKPENHTTPQKRMLNPERGENKDN